MATEVLGTIGTGMDNERKIFYSKMLLARFVPALEHANHGLAEDIPAHAGKQIEKRRFESYTVNISASTLTEGTPPSAMNGTWTALTFTISQYGAFAYISDVLESQGYDGIDDMINAFGEHAGNTIDQVIRDAIVGGSTVYYAGGVAGRANINTTNVLSSTEVRKAVRKLRANNAKPFDDGYFHVIMHPDCEYDLQGDSLVQNVYFYNAERGEDSPMIQGSVPAIFGAKFYRTTNAKQFANAGNSGAVNVYATLFLGRDAYLVSRFSSQNVKTIVKQLGSAGTNDPLDQVMSVGWKASAAAGILNNAALVRVESAASQSGT